MNFYKRHLGDVAKGCGHLSQGQMGAYDLLLDWVYGNEKPLPASREALYRIARATTKAERANVDSVLAEFFSLTEEGYTQKRAMEEISQANAQAEINRRAAQSRWDANRMRNAYEPHTASHTKCNPSQTPDSRHQNPEKENTPPAPPVPPADAGSKSLSVKDLVAEGVDSGVAADWFRVRKAKRAPLTITAWEAIKREAVKAKLSLGEIVRMMAEKSWQGFSAEWVQGKATIPEQSTPRQQTCSVSGCQNRWVTTLDRKPFCKTHADEIYAAQDSARSPPPANLQGLVGKVSSSFAMK